MTPLHIGLSLSPTWLRANSWRRPDSRAEQLVDPAFTIDAARLAEDAKLDFLLKPDALGASPLGVADSPGFTALDPHVTMAHLAGATSRIGLVPTISTTFDHPYRAARQVQSLQWVSNGRAGWNAVTALDGQGNFGHVAMPAAERRYAQAEEFVSVVHALWGSFPADALVVDRATGRFADPGAVRPIDHRGDHFTVTGPITVPTHPAGRPPMVQAGASTAGLAFAARFADAVFASTPTVETAIDLRADLARRAVAARRDARAVRVLPGLSVFVDRTLAGARELYAASRLADDRARRLDHLAVNLGFDPANFGANDRIGVEHLPVPAPAVRSRTHAQLLRRVIETERPTLTELLDRPEATPSAHWQIVGTPDTAVAEILAWADAGAIDGFVALPGGSWDSLSCFTTEVIPRLVAAGRFRAEYTGTTLRDHLGMASSSGDDDGRVDRYS